MTAPVFHTLPPFPRKVTRSDFPTMGELCEPPEGQAVRFCTAFSLSQDTQLHGINGFYRDGRFWSVDMADHWSPHEVTNWQGASP